MWLNLKMFQDLQKKTKETGRFLRGFSWSGSAQSTARCSTGGILPKEKANQVWVIGKSGWRILQSRAPIHQKIWLPECILFRTISTCINQEVWLCWAAGLLLRPLPHPVPQLPSRAGSELTCLSLCPAWQDQAQGGTGATLRQHWDITEHPTYISCRNWTSSGKHKEILNSLKMTCFDLA